MDKERQFHQVLLKNLLFPLIHLVLRIPETLAILQNLVIISFHLFSGTLLYQIPKSTFSSPIKFLLLKSTPY